MVRAAITDDEWASVRMKAILGRTTTQAWIGSAIREKLEREGNQHAAS